MENKTNSLNKTARLAGLAYLIWIITGLFGLMYVPSHTIVKGDPVATASKILANEFLFRTGIINDLINLAIGVALLMLLYRLFKKVNEHQAKLMVTLLFVTFPVVFIMNAFNITSLMLIKGEVLKTFELSQRQDLAMFLFRMNDYGSMTVEMFWGLWLFPLGILVYKSRFLPRLLGVWLIITGIFYLILSFTSIMLPQYKDVVFNSPFALPAELGEVALMLWLLIMGAKNNAGTKAIST
jgi:hypothetical protein